MGYAVLLYDLENLGSLSLTEIHQTLARAVNIRSFAVQRAFARWNLQPEKKLQELYALACDPIPVTGSGKNAAHLHLIHDALLLAQYLPSLETYVLATDDSDFCDLVTRLRNEFGKTVIGCGTVGASKLLKATCNHFVPIVPSNETPRNTFQGFAPVARPSDGSEEAGSDDTGDELVMEARAVLNSQRELIGENGVALAYLVTVLREKISDFDNRRKGVFRPKTLIKLACGSQFRLIRNVTGDYKVSVSQSA